MMERSDLRGAEVGAKGAVVARQVVVVGAGIVGVSLAHTLAGREDVHVTVLDRDPVQPRGSTPFAPGFVGLYNDVPVLTDLARASAEVYDSAGRGFRRSGGLELATTEDGAAEIERRVEAALASGLPASMSTGAGLPGPVAEFVDAQQVRAVGSFDDDGSADVPALTTRLRAGAVSHGAEFVPGQEVVGIDHRRSGISVSTATGEEHLADDVVLAGGIWGPALARLVGLDLPLVPVAHPYVYDAPGPHSEGPFVRWPERHVYARVHGDRLGIGSYDHAPVPVDQHELTAGAGLPWSADLDPVVESAQGLLRPGARFTPRDRVNGVFAMTPDNLPFVGRHPGVEGIWVAQAIWVTHAAGAAARLVHAMLGERSLPDELRVDRFDGGAPATLRESALRLYRDIYAHDAE